MGLGFLNLIAPDWGIEEGLFYKKLILRWLTHLHEYMLPSLRNNQNKASISKSRRSILWHKAWSLVPLCCHVESTIQQEWCRDPAIVNAVVWEGARTTRKLKNIRCGETIVRVAEKCELEFAPASPQHWSNIQNGLWLMSSRGCWERFCCDVQNEPESRAPRWVQEESSGQPRIVRRMLFPPCEDIFGALVDSCTQERGWIISLAFSRSRLTLCWKSYRQSRNLVQSTAKVYHAQLYLGTKIYSPYSISVTSSYSRSYQILTTLSPPPNFTIKSPGPSFFDPLNHWSRAIAGYLEFNNQL